MSGLDRANSKGQLQQGKQGLAYGQESSRGEEAYLGRSGKESYHVSRTDLGTSMIAKRRLTLKREGA